MRLTTLALSLLLFGLCKAHPQYPTGGGGGALPDPAAVTGCQAYTHDCVPYYQCKDGYINTDGAGLIDVRVKPQGECVNIEYPEVPSVCCQIPGATPPSLPACTNGQVCVAQGQCRPDGTVNTDGAGLINTRLYTNCYITPGSHEIGVCCAPPIPRIETCPAGSYCALQSLCIGQILDSVNTFQPYGNQATWFQCPMNGNYGEKQVCCRDPPPPKIETCPAGSYCAPQNLCLTQILDSVNAFQPYGNQATWSQCPLDGNYGEKQVCCQDPPAPVIDTCPGSSVCTPELLCTGHILDKVNEYQPYGNQATWTQCPLEGNYDNKGVCCRVNEPLRAASQCGIRNYGLDLKVLKKNEADFGEFPWQAVLFFSNFTFKCGASLVTDRHLLTGAHCVHGYTYGDFKVRLGEWTVNTYDEPLPYLDVDIAAITIHPGFNSANLHNDIAVIELTAPVSFQYHINTVCLPTQQQSLQPNTRCFASGWGKNAFEGNYQATLKKVDVPFVPHSYCQDLLRQTRLGRYFQLDQSFMCAGGEENQDACTGDGGGPLVCEDPVTGSYTLWGITAWGINCGQKDVPGVYVDVQYFDEWISQAIFGVAPVEVTAPHNPYGRK